jgi:hypothetical protein
VKHWTSVCLGGTGLLVPSAELSSPQWESGILTLWEARALLLSGIVGSAEPSRWGEASWHQQNSKTWSWGSLKCVVAGS